MVSPIATGQTGIGDSGSGIGGVDKLTVAGVDTHMGDTAGICTVEEHDIAGLQIGLGYIGALVVLVSGGAVGGVAQALQNIIHQAGAVKAAGRGTAVNIGNT